MASTRLMGANPSTTVVTTWMTTSRVTFSPVGVRPYSGTVIALSGDHIVAELQNASGQSLRLTIDLRIDNQTRTVTGSVHGERA